MEKKIDEIEASSLRPLSPSPLTWREYFLQKEKDKGKIVIGDFDALILNLMKQKL
jgi:hypothetical protein